MSDNDDDVAIRRGKSIAHHYMSSKMVYVSFDVETGGENVELFRCRQIFSEKTSSEIIITHYLGRGRLVFEIMIDT